MGAGRFPQPPLRQRPSPCMAGIVRAFAVTPFTLLLSRCRSCQGVGSDAQPGTLSSTGLDCGWLHAAVTKAHSGPGQWGVERLVFGFIALPVFVSFSLTASCLLCLLPHCCHSLPLSFSLCHRRLKHKNSLIISISKEPCAVFPELL